MKNLPAATFGIGPGAEYFDCVLFGGGGRPWWCRSPYVLAFALEIGLREQ